ncbi:MAG: MFS transporter, partial [Ruthenibacterium lactatiformans]
WKFGTRNEGTTYALHSFFRKLAQGIGPSLGLALATWLGYNAALGPNQSIEVATNMRYLVAAMYLVSALLQLVAYGVIYNLDKKTLAQMEKDLGKRRDDAKADLSKIIGGELILTVLLQIFSHSNKTARCLCSAVLLALAAGYGNCCRGWRKPCQNRSERQLSPPSIFLYSEVSHVRV